MFPGEWIVGKPSSWLDVSLAFDLGFVYVLNEKEEFFKF